jgi:hypothetical protein
MKDLKLNVEGYSQFTKNLRTGTVINNNLEEISAAQLRKKNKLEKQEDNLRIKSDIESLKDEMSEIKSLLKQMVEK